MSDVLDKVLAVYDVMGRRETIQLYNRASYFEEDARCIIVNGKPAYYAIGPVNHPKATKKRIILSNGVEYAALREGDHL